MKVLYKYPQEAFPYERLVEENRRRGRQEAEFELADTGIFDQHRYFDVVVEYAKASPDDILIQITVANRGPDPARLHVLPTIWFRNTWSWTDGAARPVFQASAGSRLAAVELLPAALCDLPSGWGSGEGGVRRPRAVPARSGVARPGAVPRVLSWRDRRRPRREPPDRLDGARGQAASAERRAALKRAGRQMIRSLRRPRIGAVTSPITHACRYPSKARRSSRPSIFAGGTPSTSPPPVCGSKSAR